MSLIHGIVLHLLKSTMNKMNFAVRIAKIGDLPVIHNLIRDSFAAMVPFYDPGFPHSTDEWVKQAIDGDLNPDNFDSIYISKPNSYYWVIENSESHEVCGCGASNNTVIMKLTWFEWQYHQCIEVKILVPVLLMLCLISQYQKDFNE